MPLTQTIYGGECPLEKFEIDVAAGGGCYTNDPVEACMGCNFVDMDSTGFDLEKICQCPVDMTWTKYEELKKQYVAIEGQKTKSGFQEFIRTSSKPKEVKKEIKKK